jgi:hypothetical protein
MPICATRLAMKMARAPEPTGLGRADVDVRMGLWEATTGTA